MIYETHPGGASLLHRFFHQAFGALTHFDSMALRISMPVNLKEANGLSAIFVPMLVRHDARGDFWMADDGGVRLFMASYALN
jgi:hypothetical protein